ncbi:MAG: alpha-galactosidase [Candidatus Hydrogenedentes bacterium]|nr:alpha-galactosidase [Candidatus Hydrogenedentota bacterium]
MFKLGFSSILAGVFMTLTSIPSAFSVTVTPEEQAQAHRWAAAKFDGKSDAPPVTQGIEVVANNDAVQLNSRAGKPLRIGDKEYTRGLYCHAVSKVIVRLPGAGKTFNAVAGVDSNEQTSGGRGSVVFSVSAGGTERFRSGVMREGMPGAPVEVDLGGATEFVLEVGDAGDGISCDQADWAEARVILADGRALMVGNLPLLGGSDAAAITTEPPFSFTYGGKPFAEILKDEASWKVVRGTSAPDGPRSRHEVTYHHAATGLEVRCVAVEYLDFPTVEWTLYFKNTGTADTPIIEQINALDIRTHCGAKGGFVLRHHTGSPYSATDYQPFETPLGPKSAKHIATSGGRPTDANLPYFNIETQGRGLIAVVGWPGQWAAEFARDDTNGLRVSGGQELTHFTLHPGEEVRGPLVALQFYEGDFVRSQNIWRRWMVAHNVPRPGGKLPPSPQMAACSSHQFGEMINANEENQILFVDRYLEEKLPLDYWWMDAGWYFNATGWPNTGTWEVDTKRFPRGLRAITDHAHAKGVKSIVWFEPERVTPGTWLYEKHPEWLLGKDGEQKLLNLGNAEARAWLTDHVDGLLTNQGIDLYRQDFNMEPLEYWRKNDAADRQGITEIQHVTGYLAYWDELRKRHPNMLIDSCASGGRRNDLETLRRAVPLLRSDFILEPVSQQLHTYGISFWMPFFGTGVNSFDPYVFRSQMCPNIISCYDVRKADSDYESLRKMLRQWQDIAPDYYGDYYPLTSYHVEGDVWMAWQFDCPEEGRGFVAAFRRSESPYGAATFVLRGLEPASRYEVKNLDETEATLITGGDLMEKGLTITVSTKPGSALLTYRRAAK